MFKLLGKEFWIQLGYIVGFVAFIAVWLGIHDFLTQVVSQ